MAIYIFQRLLTDKEHLQNQQINHVAYFVHHKRNKKNETFVDTVFLCSVSTLLNIFFTNHRTSFIVPQKNKSNCTLDPNCQADPPDAPPGSTLLSLKSDVQPPGSWAEYACKANTKLTLVARCEEDGTWSKVFGECPEDEEEDAENKNKTGHKTDQ